MDPKALPRWPGVSGVLSCSFTITDGITPSIATLECVPQRGLQYSGTFAITYGGTTIAFPDARVQDVEQVTSDTGATTWKLSIADRRWRWKNSATISGYYNVRRSTVALVAGTERTPRQLANMLLDAMGERDYDVAALPNDTRPEVTWDAANPAEELARLCESLGCRIVLSVVTNKVRIVKAGEGSRLARAFAMEASIGVDPPDPPGRLHFIGGRTQFQGDFRLQAVGRDVDGTVRPINELSYAPPTGWRLSDSDHFNDVPDKANRALAQESVWRWYRILPPFRLPGIGAAINSRELVLPLLGEQIETYVVDGIERPREPWVWGQFWRGTEAHQDDVRSPDPACVNKPKNLYTQGFSVDEQTGIVKFNDPVYRLEDDPTQVAGKRIYEAIIYLRIACNLREDLATRAWMRHEAERKLSTASALRSWTQIVKRDDVVRRLYRYYVPPVGLRDNLAEVQRAATHYLDAVEAEYRVTDVGSVSYAGIFRFDLDGAIRQITWSIQEDGRAITRASRNREEPVVSISYAERRFLEKLGQVGRDAARNERQRAEDQARNRG